MIFPIKIFEDIKKPMSYAKRLLNTAKFGITISVSKKRNPRSSNQNRYYFGIVLRQLSDETGNTVDEMHEIMKQKFLLIEKCVFNDEIYEITQSTTKLNTAEMEVYLEKIRRFASMELNIVILLPNESEF
jgi:hypothetical protein